MTQLNMRIGGASDDEDMATLRRQLDTSRESERPRSQELHDARATVDELQAELLRLKTINEYQERKLSESDGQLLGLLTRPGSAQLPPTAATNSQRGPHRLPENPVSRSSSTKPSSTDSGSLIDLTGQTKPAAIGTAKRKLPPSSSGPPRLPSKPSGSLGTSMQKAKGTNGNQPNESRRQELGNAVTSSRASLPTPFVQAPSATRQRLLPPNQLGMVVSIRNRLGGPTMQETGSAMQPSPQDTGFTIAPAQSLLSTPAGQASSFLDHRVLPASHSMMAEYSNPVEPPNEEGGLSMGLPPTISNTTPVVLSSTSFVNPIEGMDPFESFFDAAFHVGTDLADAQDPQPKPYRIFDFLSFVSAREWAEDNQACPICGKSNGQLRGGHLVNHVNGHEATLYEEDWEAFSQCQDFTLYLREFYEERKKRRV